EEHEVHVRGMDGDREVLDLRVALDAFEPVALDRPRRIELLPRAAAVPVELDVEAGLALDGGVERALARVVVVAHAELDVRRGVELGRERRVVQAERGPAARALRVTEEDVAAAAA